MYGALQTNLHLDILMGRDEVIEPSDVFLGDVSHCIIFDCQLIFPRRDGDWPFTGPS